MAWVYLATDRGVCLLWGVTNLGRRLGYVPGVSRAQRKTPLREQRGFGCKPWR